MSDQGWGWSLVRARQARDAGGGDVYEPPDALAIGGLGPVPAVPEPLPPPRRYPALVRDDDGESDVRIIGPDAPASGVTRQKRLPTAADDLDGLYAGLLWAAWAVEECGRGFTRLSSRLAKVEQRLDEVEAVAREAAEPAEPARPAGPDVDQLAARMSERHDQASRRIDTLENRLRQLDFVPLKVSNLQRDVDQLAAAQHPVRADGEVETLRRELAATQRRVAAVEGRVDVPALTQLVDDAVRRHVERLAEQAPPATVDVEGIYRELDSVAEFVASRAAATAESLERLGPIELTLLELRRESDRRLRDVEARMERIEASGRKVERLIAAVHEAVQIDEAPPAIPPSAPPGAGNGTAAGSANGTAPGVALAGSFTQGFLSGRATRRPLDLEGG